MTSGVVLPELEWKPTTAKQSRAHHSIHLIVVHRWGVRYVSEHGEAQSYVGVIREFKDPANEASAHVVYPGGALPNHATQMVAWNEAAWTEAAYNDSSIGIESADAIWLGHDPFGFHQLARIVAGLLTYNRLPCRWSTSSGFCRHADLGSAGGGHTECPTTDLALWRAFEHLVAFEYQRNGFRPKWGVATAGAAALD